MRARQDPASGRVLLALQLADTEAASMLEACARAALQPGTAASPAAEPDTAPAGPGPAIRAPGARLALLHAYAAAARLAARLPDTRERPARMPLEPCGPSAAHGGDVIVAAVARGSGADGAGGAAAGGARAEAAAGLTRRGALARLAFLVDPPRGLAGRLLEAVRAAQGLAGTGSGRDRVWPGPGCAAQPAACLEEPAMLPAPHTRLVGPCARCAAGARADASGRAGRAATRRARRARSRRARWHCWPRPRARRAARARTARPPSGW